MGKEKATGTTLAPAEDAPLYIGTEEIKIAQPAPEKMPQAGMYITQAELKSFVRALLREAILENSPAGCFILARRGALRPLTEAMPNDNQAWLRAAEMLGWERKPSA